MTFLQHLLTSITSVIRLKTCTLDSLHEIKNITVQVKVYSVLNTYLSSMSQNYPS